MNIVEISSNVEISFPTMISVAIFVMVVESQDCVVEVKVKITTVVAVNACKIKKVDLVQGLKLRLLGKK